MKLVGLFLKIVILSGILSLCTLSFAYDSFHVKLNAQLTLSDLGASSGNGCWGYISESGREYALMGCDNKVAFVEITDPDNPVYFAFIPHTSSTWADIKVYKNYCYVVTEASGSGIQVIDLSFIDNHIVTLVNVVPFPGRSHNVAVDTKSGFLYTAGSHEGPGTTVCFSLADPANPVKVGKDSMTENYAHDIMPYTYTAGPYAGRQILFCSSEDRGVEIYDVTDKNNPFLVKTVTYPNIGYCHQAWMSEDEKYLYVDDEFDEWIWGYTTRTIVLDVSSLENAHYVTTFTSGSSAIDHNQYYRDGFVFQANYTSGLRIFDANDNPTSPPQVGWFDTYPFGDPVAFEGAWNCFAFFNSNTVIVSDINRGLFILDPAEALTRIVVPYDLKLLKGSIISGWLSELAYSDNIYLRLRPFALVPPSQPQIQIEISGKAPSTTPSLLNFDIESATDVSGIIQTIEILNFETNTWQLLDSRNTALSDTEVKVSATGNLQNYVNPDDKSVRVRLSWKAERSSVGLPWTVRVDKTVWEIAP